MAQLSRILDPTRIEIRCNGEWFRTLSFAQTVRVTAGQVHERPLVLASGTEPLRVTLAYTDVPGFPAVLPALVNDLDLEVVGPDGRIYRGNQFDVPVFGIQILPPPA